MSPSSSAIRLPKFGPRTSALPPSTGMEAFTRNRLSPPHYVSLRRLTAVSVRATRYLDAYGSGLWLDHSAAGGGARSGPGSGRQPSTHQPSTHHHAGQTGMPDS